MSSRPADNLGPLLASRRRAAGVLDVGLTKLDELIRDGEIEVVRDGRFVRVVMASIPAYIRRHSTVPDDSQPQPEPQPRKQAATQSAPQPP